MRAWSWTHGLMPAPLRHGQKLLGTSEVRGPRLTWSFKSTPRQPGVPHTIDGASHGRVLQQTRLNYTHGSPQVALLSHLRDHSTATCLHRIYIPTGRTLELQKNDFYQNQLTCTNTRWTRHGERITSTFLLWVPRSLCAEIKVAKKWLHWQHWVHRGHESLGM